MATGYTYPVKEGKVTDLRTFALQCARAFGALIEMRDASPDAPIPERFKPSEHYAERLAEAKRELERLRGLTPAQIRVEWVAAKAETDMNVRRCREETARTLGNYRAMLAQVNDWEPPTREHLELKKFMVTQLEYSIKHDSFERNPDPMPTEAVWHKQRVADKVRDVADFAEEQRKEEARVAGRQRWIDALRDSLPEREPTVADDAGDRHENEHRKANEKFQADIRSLG